MRTNHFPKSFHHQEPIAYTFIILDGQSEIIHHKSHVGKKAARSFYPPSHGLSMKNGLRNYLTRSRPMEITEEEENLFSAPLNCYHVR